MKLYALILILIIPVFVNAQITNSSRIESLRLRLESLSEDVPGLKNKVSFSISGVSLSEFLRALAINNKINMDVEPNLDTSIAVNFNDVTISNLLVYLCDQHDLEILVNGNIISVVRYISTPVEKPKLSPKILSVNFSKETNTLSFDLQNDTLGVVLKNISMQSGINVIAPQKVQNSLVSGYIKDMNLYKGLSELAHMNSLSFSQKDSVTCYIEDVAKSTANLFDQPKNAKNDELKVNVNGKDSLVSVQAYNVPLKDVFVKVASQFKINYFLFSDLKGDVNIKLDQVDVGTFMHYLFNGTDYTFKCVSGIYLVGDRKLEEIRTSDVYGLKYRTVTKIIEMIPGELRKGLEVIPLTDLNSIVISGSRPAVSELENFLRQIDKVVPVVNIDLTIMDVSNTHAVSTGISAGIDNTKKTTYASVFPNFDFTLGSNAINGIINSINGTGLVNLGKVNADFYLSLKASEDNGSIKIRSTPRLATLNGTEAKMTIGETRYYAEQTSNIITTQSTTTVSSVVYKPLQANLAITITPIVSQDEQITFEISVEQATFTSQVATNGPFGQTSRTFKSSVRVKNNEMILLGGLEEKSDSNTGKGTPLLSRIPILKWIFSSRDSNVKKSKLAILIHPTVFY